MWSRSDACGFLTPKFSCKRSVRQGVSSLHSLILSSRSTAMLRRACQLQRTLGSRIEKSEKRFRPQIDSIPWRDIILTCISPSSREVYLPEFSGA